MPTERVRASWGFEEGDEIAPGRIALQALGGGWDFEVFLVWDEHLYSLAVAKLVRPNLVGDPHTLRSLTREAGLLERLAHPVIVRGFGATLGGERPHLLLEHLEGSALSSSIRRGAGMDVHEVVPLAFQVASGLQYLANEGVVHLDVKPDNIIFGAPPRLVDLSVARSLADAARLTGPVGTDAYMAPEQCDPSIAPVGTPADVWGLGATLFHAIVGTVPFPRPEGSDRRVAEQRFPQLAAASVPRLPQAHPLLAELVTACLAREPSERPSPGEVASGLEPLIDVMRPRIVLGRQKPRFR
ncbi:MAG: serine/threonine-protein kinase [Actinomycetota bacterium]